MSKKKRTLKQNRIIWSLLNKFRFSHDARAEMVYDITEGRTQSTKEMYFDEANEMIHRLGGKPISKSRRTVNYHRKKAGIKQIATKKHLKLMNDLADKRKMSETGLGDLSARVNKGVRDPRTTKEVNRVIEAIKAMNKRDKTFDSFKKKEAA